MQLIASSVNELGDDINNESSKADSNKTESELALNHAQTLYNLAENALSKAKITRQNAERRLQDAEDWKGSLYEDYRLVEEMEARKNKVKAMAYRARLEKEYSESYHLRNKYNVNWEAVVDRDEVGIGKLIFVDESGTPYLYKINRKPEYEGETYYPDGKRNYYPAGSKTTAIDPTDNKLELLADGSYIITKKDQTSYHYSYYGKLIRIEEPNGRYLELTYNDKKELVKITDSFQRIVTIDRVNGKIVKITDPIGRTYSYSYNGSNLTAFTDAGGNTERYQYSQVGMTELTYPDGTGWKYFYTEIDGKMVSITDPVGTTTFSYNQFNKISSVTDKNGHTTSYNYDNRGNLTGINYPDGSIRNFNYNELGLLISEIDQRGDRTDYSYDEFGNVKEKKYPDGSIEKFQFDKVGRLIKETNALGDSKLYQYDGAGNLIVQTNEAGISTKYSYDQLENGLLLWTGRMTILVGRGRWPVLVFRFLSGRYI